MGWVRRDLKIHLVLPLTTGRDTFPQPSVLRCVFSNVCSQGWLLRSWFVMRGTATFGGSSVLHVIKLYIFVYF